MKIVRLTTYHAAPRWLFLKVETDEGISGWGEPVIEGRAHAVEADIDREADSDREAAEEVATSTPRGPCPVRG